MTFDAAVSLRIVNNLRLMRARHYGEYRNLGGALALVSDIAIEDFNCLEAFTTDDLRIEGALDVGFSLLRAFDRPPCAIVTPLDRPRSIAGRLRARGLTERFRLVAMVFRGSAGRIAANAALRIRRVEPELARTFAETQHAAFGEPAWYKSFLIKAAYANVLDEDQSFYLGLIDGEPVATAIVVREGETAGLYAIGTLKTYRRQGVASTMIARCISDAGTAGCDVIGLNTLAEGDARRLYERLGFAVAHETALWLKG